MIKKTEKLNSASQPPVRRLRRKARNARPSERGLGPSGGAWNIAQASAWCGIGEAHLRQMGKDGLYPVIKVGRRLLIPREGFQRWFNAGRTSETAA